MIEGTICDNCGLRKATKYWHGGQALCNECYSKWDEKEKKIRGGTGKLTEEKADKEKKKEGQTTLF